MDVDGFRSSGFITIVRLWIWRKGPDEHPAWSRWIPANGNGYILSSTIEEARENWRLFGICTAVQYFPKLDVAHQRVPPHELPFPTKTDCIGKPIPVNAPAPRRWREITM